MTERVKKIGVFDSGFGGLSILKHIIELMPEYDYVYLGDTARVPYGNRSAETVYEFTVQALEFLFAQGCDLVVLACNTASCDALKKIQREFLVSKYPSKKVLGVIIPACEEVALTSQKIGLVATRNTVNSKAFERELASRNSNLELFAVACPLLVPVIEAGEEHNSELIEILFKKYLTPLVEAQVDTVILGCTHYGIIQDQIANFMGDEVKIINEGPIVAKKLKEYLFKHTEIEQCLAKNGSLIVYTTDLPAGFKELGEKFYGKSLEVKQAKLDYLQAKNSESSVTDVA